MRRNHRVAVLSDASFAPFDPLRHPPQGVSVHSRNDGGDTGGRGQGPIMDGLVAELGGGILFLNFFCYEVIVKQYKKKSSANHYSRHDLTRL